jgi:DNA-directed RNA polymerase subunit F
MNEEKIIELKPISMNEVKDVLKEKMAEKELNYEQELTLKYVDKFSKLTEKQTESVLKELDEIMFLTGLDEVKYQLVAALPTNIEQVRLFLPKDVTPSDDELQQVVEVTKKFGDKL